MKNHRKKFWNGFYWEITSDEYGALKRAILTSPADVKQSEAAF